MSATSNVKDEIQKLNNRLDKSRSKLAGAEKRAEYEVIAQIKDDIEKLSKKIARLKTLKNRQMNSQGKDIQALAFNRAITKTEQADIGKLKKSVRGLIIVHPMTALGKEMSLDVMTGFAPKEF